MQRRYTRRRFLHTSASIAAAAAAVRAASRLAAAEGESTPAPKLPSIRLGKLEVSRLILGSNPFFGFAHQPGDLSRRMREYYTDERVMRVLDDAAEHGITAVWTPCYDGWIRLWNRYQERGGKLKIWIGQPDPPAEKMKDAILACAKNGGKAVCIQGERIDEQFRAGRLDVVREWLELVKSLDLPAGIASHKPETHLIAEEKGLPTDFYHQCLYQPEDYDAGLREKALATIAKLEKPAVAYKVLAAGRLAPKDAFPYVLSRLKAKDGLCVGVFPKDADHVGEDTGLVRKLSGEKRAGA